MINCCWSMTLSNFLSQDGLTIRFRRQCKNVIEWTSRGKYHQILFDFTQHKGRKVKSNVIRIQGTSCPCGRRRKLKPLRVQYVLYVPQVCYLTIFFISAKIWMVEGKDRYWQLRKLNTTLRSLPFQPLGH